VLSYNVIVWFDVVTQCNYLVWCCHAMYFFGLVLSHNVIVRFGVVTQCNCLVSLFTTRVIFVCPGPQGGPGGADTTFASSPLNKSIENTIYANAILHPSCPRTQCVCPTCSHATKSGLSTRFRPPPPPTTWAPYGRGIKPTLIFDSR